MCKNYLYCRVSTDDKGQEFDRQKLIITQKNIKIDKVFEEKISGGIKGTERTEFSKLLDVLEETDTIYVSETSRLGRNYIDCFEMIDIITKDKKANLVIVSNGINLLGGEKMDKNQWFMLSQMLLLDEYQKRNIGDLTRQGLAAKKAGGVKLGRKTIIDLNFDIEAFKKDRYILDYECLISKYKISRQTVAKYIGMIKRGEI